MGIKFKKIFFSLLLLSLLLGGFSACGGGTGGSAAPTSTPPVPVFGDFVLGVAVSNPASSATLSSHIRGSMRSNSVALQNNAILLEETRNVVSDISFNPVGSDSEDIEFPGMYVVELITGGSTVNQVFPELEPTRIPFGEYREFEMKFEKIQSSEIPSALLEDPVSTQFLPDQSMVIEGSFIESSENDIDGSDSQTYIPFRIISDKDVNILVSSPNAFTVSSDRVNYFFIAFQVNNWFTNLLAPMQEVSSEDLTNGVLVISDQSSQDSIHEILDQFESNLETSCKSAPSESDEFEEDDVDDDSSSDPF